MEAATFIHIMMNVQKSKIILQRSQKVLWMW